MGYVFCIEPPSSLELVASYLRNHFLVPSITSLPPPSEGKQKHINFTALPAEVARTFPPHSTTTGGFTTSDPPEVQPRTGMSRVQPLAARVFRDPSGRVTRLWQVWRGLPVLASDTPLSSAD